jgi:hypothetical protein
MWTLVIFAIGTMSLGHLATNTQIGKITGFSTLSDCYSNAIEVRKTPGLYTECIQMEVSSYG